MTSAENVLKASDHLLTTNNLKQSGLYKKIVEKQQMCNFVHDLKHNLKPRDQNLKHLKQQLETLETNLKHLKQQLETLETNLKQTLEQRESQTASLESTLKSCKSCKVSYDPCNTNLEAIPNVCSTVGAECGATTVKRCKSGTWCSLTALNGDMTCAQNTQLYIGSGLCVMYGSPAVETRSALEAALTTKQHHGTGTVQRLRKPEQHIDAAYLCCVQRLRFCCFLSFLLCAKFSERYFLLFEIGFLRQCKLLLDRNCTKRYQAKPNVNFLEFFRDKYSINKHDRTSAKGALIPRHKP